MQVIINVMIKKKWTMKKIEICIRRQLLITFAVVVMKRMWNVVMAPLWAITRLIAAHICLFWHSFKTGPFADDVDFEKLVIWKRLNRSRVYVEFLTFTNHLLHLGIQKKKWLTAIWVATLLSHSACIATGCNHFTAARQATFFFQSPFFWDNNWRLC